MALIACVECENDISEMAESCPKCGAPNQELSKLHEVNISGGLDNDVAKELVRQAELEVGKKNLCLKLGSIEFGKSYSNYINTSNSGKKISLQIKWQHGILADHYKDMDVSVSTSNTYRGTGSSRRVTNTQTHVNETKYDFIDFIDHDENEKKYRLTDTFLDKIKAGSVMSLGTILFSYEGLDDEGMVVDPVTLGQEWDGEIQPSIIVSYGTGKSSPVHEEVHSSWFEKYIVSTSIGYWHLCWVLAVVCMFWDGHRTDTDVVIIGSLLGVSLLVKLVRLFKKSGHVKNFKSWYLSAADELLDVSRLNKN